MIPVYLGLVLLSAILGAYTDIYFGCVRNKHLFFALIAWLILILTEHFLLNSSSLHVLPLALNVSLSVIVSVIFYLADIWAPGDCKLYIVISLIFPVNAYVKREGNVFPSLDFVIYAFALGYIFLIANTLRRKEFGTMSINLKFNLKHVLSILENTGTILFMNTLINTFVSEFFYANQMLCILSSVMFVCMIQKKADALRKITGIAGLACSMIQCTFLSSLLNIFMNMAISLITASAIEFITSRVRVNTYREVSCDEIRPGMILSFASLWDMRKCIDPELPKMTTENRRSRLTENQSEAVKRWCRNSGRNAIIVEMMPFAPFIAGSVVIEILRFILLGQ